MTILRVGLLNSVLGGVYSSTLAVLLQLLD
jgi:hypothetical protein